MSAIPGPPPGPGPATSAERGSHSRTVGSRSGYSSSETYGGFDTTRSIPPSRRPGRASNHDPAVGDTRPAATGSWAASASRLARVTSRASSEESTAHTSRGSPKAAPSTARERAMAPEPVPRSTQTSGPSSPSVARRAAARRPSIPRATSTTCSVSGRGISTRRSTCNSTERNGHVPSTYCSGSPEARRAARSSERSRTPARSPAGDRPGVLDDPARLPHRTHPVGDLGHQLGPGPSRRGRAVGAGRHHGLNPRRAAGSACRPSARRSARRGRPSGRGRACAG